MEPALEIESEVEIQPHAAKELSQDDVLQAALKLFAQKGYFNTSLTDIKDAVGLKTNNGIYQFFKTKQAIAETLRENILDSLSISIDDIRRRNRKASEQLREIVDLLFKLTDEAPEIIQFLLFMRAEDFLPEATPLLDTPAFLKIKRVIQNGIKDGEIRSVDYLLAYSYFFGIINQTLLMILNKSLPKSADSYQSQVWLAAWGSIAKK
jgi:AcrR family transcriptional regulator